MALSYCFMFVSIGGRGPVRLGSGEGPRDPAEARSGFRESADPRRIIAEDRSHSSRKKRSYCFGVVEGGILTGWFTYRGTVTRIYGAGY